MSQSITQQKTKPLPLFIKGSQELAGSLLIPESFSGKGNYELYNNSMGGVNFYYYFEAQNTNGAYIGGASSMNYVYSDFWAQQSQLLGTPMKELRYPLTLEQIIQQDLGAYLQSKGYTLGKVEDFKTESNPQTGITYEGKRFELIGSKKASLSVGKTYNKQPGTIFWSYSYLLSEALTSEEVTSLQDLTFKSFETNPSFSLSINQINQQVLRNNDQAFQGIMSSMRARNQAWQQSFDARYEAKKTSSNQEALNERRSDAILGVASYVDPNTGTTYKMPTTNDYYYKNNVGDLIGTNSNSPLNNPNTYDTKYNWVELQKKYD